MRDLDLDVVMSNPYLTRLIAKSKKKTDRFDAHALADLLRGGYIYESYVLPPKTVEEKRAIRFRTGMVQNRTRMKNMIHGILLQESIKIPGRTFTPAFNRALHGLKDWRIDEYLKGISSLDERISKANFKINDMVKDNEYAQILMSIPGVGKFTALTIASEIDDISRFTDPNKLGRIHRTGPVSEKFCGNNTPWKDNPCRQQDGAMDSHRGRTCTHDTCKRHDRPDGVLQACCKKAWNIQGHRCNGCQDAARRILDAKKADYLCRMPETTHRIT